MAAVAAGVVLVTTLAVATPAAGLGSGSRRCYSNGIAYGDSAASGAATSVTAGVIECGLAKARVRTNIGWTPYVQSGTVAWAPTPAGQIAVWGGHTVSLPGLQWVNNFPFQT